MNVANVTGSDRFARQRTLQAASQLSALEARAGEPGSTRVDASTARSTYCAKVDAVLLAVSALGRSGVPAAGTGDDLNADALDLAVFDDVKVALKVDGAQRNRVASEVKAKLTESSSSMGDPVIQALIYAMEQGKANMDLYQQIVEGMTTYFEALTDVMSKMAGYITVITDDKGVQTVKVDTASLWDDLSAIENMSVSVPREQVAEWKAELNPIFDVSEDGVVSVNTAHVEAMLNSIAPPCKLYDGVNMAVYQAWETAFSAEKDAIQNNLQTIVEKYSHQNSNFDSMVKVLSGSIQTLTETAKAYLQI